MNLMVSLAGLLGFEVESITDRIKKAVIVNTVIALFGTIAAVFLLVAGFIALSGAVGPVYSALIFAGSFLLLALAVYLGSKIGEGERKRRVVEKRRSSETTAFVTTAALTALPVLLRSPAIRTIGLPLAAVAAFMLVKGGTKGDED